LTRKSRRTTLSITAVSLIGMVLYEAGVNHIYIWRTMASLSIFRVFFLTKTFAKIMYTVGRALEEMEPFIPLTIALVLEFNIIAYDAFKGAAEVDYGGAEEIDAFGTITQSLVTITNLGIGEWQDIMMATITGTSYAAIIYFATFTLVVCLLLLNLLAGIVLAMAEVVEQELGSQCGACQYVLAMQFNLNNNTRGHVYMIGALLNANSPLPTNKPVQCHLDDTPLHIAALRIQTFLRKRYATKLLHGIHRIKQFVKEQGGSYKMVLRSIEDAHTRGDLSRTGVICSSLELTMATNCLWEAWEMSADNDGQDQQFIEFAVAIVKPPSRHPMTLYVFAVWFFEQFIFPRQQTCFHLPKQNSLRVSRMRSRLPDLGRTKVQLFLSAVDALGSRYL